MNDVDKLALHDIRAFGSSSFDKMINALINAPEEWGIWKRSESNGYDNAFMSGFKDHKSEDRLYQNTRKQHPFSTRPVNGVLRSIQMG